MKKFFSLVLALVMALSLTTVAWGASVDEAALVDVAANGGTVTLDQNITLYDTLKIAAGKTVTLNLGGYTLSIVSKDVHDTGTTGLPTILVEYGATLIIEGTGTVDNIRNRSAALFNNGTVTLNGGTYTRSAEAGVNGSTNANSYYTIVNHGVMTIGAGASVNNSGDYSTAITNGYSGKSTGTGKDWAGMTSIHVNGENAANPTLTINGGTFTGGKHTVNNDGSGELTINAGSFSGGYKTIVRNHEVATINGGTFDGTGVVGSTVLNEYEDGISSATVELTIIGGSFVGAVAESGAVDTTVSGGTFSTDVSDYVASGYVQGGDGSVVTPVAQVGSTKYATVAEAIAAANGAPIVLLGTSVTIPAGYTVATDLNGNLVVLAGTSAPASGAKGAYYTTNLTTLAVYPSCDLANYTYTLENYTAAADAAKTFAKVAIWQTHKVTGAKTIAYTAVVAASADSANLAFVNGASITYLNTNVNTWTATATKVATVDVEDAEKCGDVFIAGDVGVYTDANGKVYYETTTGAAAYNVNGKLVMLKEAAKAYPVVDSAALKTAKASPAAGTVYTVKHDYDVDVKTVNSDKTITRVFCTECKAEFAFVEGTVEDAIKKFGAGNYTLETIDNMPVYVALTGYSAGGTVVTPSTDKVTSAETFDAGIAMYVGMSVLAATGSAVVIGKKKD